MRGFTPLQPDAQRFQAGKEGGIPAAYQKKPRLSGRVAAGFTLIEVVIYVAILSVLSVVAVGTLLRVNVVLGEIRVTRSLSDAEAAAAGYLTRVIREASMVDAAASTLDSSPGVLVLNGPEDPPVSHRFSLVQGALSYRRGAEQTIAVTPAGTLVTNLTFRHLTASTTSEVVTLDFTIEASSGRATTSHDISTTVVLRNSYAE